MQEDEEGEEEVEEKEEGEEEEEEEKEEMEEEKNKEELGSRHLLFYKTWRCNTASLFSESFSTKSGAVIQRHCFQKAFLQKVAL